MKGANDMETKVGKMIKEGRENQNLSMRQLAELAHVSHSDISRIESGEREVPNPKLLRKISKYIGINYNDLMYASGLGTKISPLNPYLIEYYSNFLDILCLLCYQILYPNQLHQISVLQFVQHY